MVIKVNTSMIKLHTQKKNWFKNIEIKNEGQVCIINRS